MFHLLGNTDTSSVSVILDRNVYYLSAWAGESSSLSHESVDAVLACLEDAYADPANGSYAQAFGSGFTRGAEAVSSCISAGVGPGLFMIERIICNVGFRMSASRAVNNLKKLLK